jgi:predicted Zn-dependent protease
VDRRDSAGDLSATQARLLERRYEASFIALDGNPARGLRGVRKVRWRVKQGHVIEIPPDKPGVADALLPIAQKAGAEAAIAEYRRLKTTDGERYDFREPQLNRLGYALLKETDVRGAIAIFRLNSELFSASANVWDSLAEAQLQAGDRDSAIVNYRKSLALNSHNEGAATALEKLGAR